MRLLTPLCALRCVCRNAMLAGRAERQQEGVHARMERARCPGSVAVLLGRQRHPPAAQDAGGRSAQARQLSLQQRYAVLLAQARLLRRRQLLPQRVDLVRLRRQNRRIRATRMASQR